jgi:2-haloacid dehalogenase
MTGAPPVEALIFDVFGTVVDWRTGVSAEVAAAAAARGLVVDAPAFADAWRARYQPAMERIRSGARPYAPLDLLHRENLDATLDAFGIGAAFDEPARAALTRAWERLPGWPDSAPGLARLRGRFLVAPCSNGSIALITRLSRFADLGWDCVLGAEIARAYKPDPAVYRAACAALGLGPRAVMMVAAHEDDLAAARAVGLATAFVARPLEHGPDRAGPAPRGGWDVAAADLLDLADRLGA